MMTHYYRESCWDKLAKRFQVFEIKKLNTEEWEVFRNGRSQGVEPTEQQAINLVSILKNWLQL